MPRGVFILALLIAAGSLGIALAAGQTPPPARAEMIDRIVAHVEDDVILLSEVRELAAYQQLVDGHSQSQVDLVNALIEQWVVRNEAEEARFSEPPAADIDAEVMRLQGNSTSAAAFRQKLDSAGLTLPGLRRIVGQQIYLERYLDYKFRPAVQIDEDAIRKYYEMELSPALRGRGQMPPSLEDVRDTIREVLVQRGINERANSWFDETKSRLDIEITPPAAVEGKK